MNGYNFSYDDKKLFNHHGVNLPGKIDHAETIKLDKINLQNGSIELSVEFYPAEFWKANIYSGVNGKTYKVNTGSGHLTSDWDRTPYWKRMINLVNGLEEESDDLFEIEVIE